MFKRTGQNQKKPPTSYGVKLALAGNMITREEAREIERGNMSILKDTLYVNGPNGLIKEHHVLYHNRANDVLIAKLLGDDGSA